MEIAVAIVLIVLAFFWVLQFVELMLRPDSDFPGRFDKALWVVAFICTNILALVAYLIWKRAVTQVRLTKQELQQDSKQKL